MNSSNTLYVKDADGTYLEAGTDDLVAATRRALRRTFRKGKAIRSPADTEAFLTAELATEPNEIFCCLYLDNRHHVIKFDRAFHGTIDGTSVYPRVIVKRALELNAAAVILAHYVTRNIMELMCPDSLCAHLA